MEIGWIAAAGVSALAAAMLLLYLLLLRRAIREVAQELEEKLRTDTNTLISISSGDRTIRALAAQMNVQLRALRQERLRLQHGDAELKTAVTNISHDLRTPLTAICGYLDLLEQEAHTAQAGRYLAVIRERTDAMRQLTDELLQYTALASQAEELRKEPVCLNDVLEQSLAGFYGALSSRGIQPEIQMNEERVIRTLDAAALRRVYDNILSNVVKYSDGDLTVRLTAEGTAVFINTSRAMSHIQAERLFDRFFTVDTAGSSTGLGLSIARMLTEKMGGSTAASCQEGRLHVSVSFPG